MERRDFLKLMGLLSGTTMAACKLEPTKLLPYLVPPGKGRLQGEPIFRPSTCTECPAGCGLRVKVQEDRPVKLEGLPGHPVGRGGLCVRGQASLSRLYHPERLTGPLAGEKGEERYDVGWDFVLEHDSGSMHVLNAVSPAFTCALPFAEMVCDRILA